MSETFQELMNGFSHVIGIPLSVIALAILLRSTVPGTRARGAAILFGSVLIAAYTASALYHLGWCCPMRKVLLALDVLGVLGLIAGTGTAYLLVQPGQQLPVLRITLLWLGAACGSFMKIGYYDLDPLVATAVDVILGWSVLTTVLVGRKPSAPVSTAWLIAGGLIYVLGVPFMTVPDIGHLIWHCFVLLGSCCHVYCLIAAVQATNRQPVHCRGPRQ